LRKKTFLKREKPLHTDLKIELVDQKLFDNKKIQMFCFLLADTIEIKKKNGTYKRNNLIFHILKLTAYEYTVNRI